MSNTNANVTLASDGIVVTDCGRFPLLTKELLERSFAVRRRSREALAAYLPVSVGRR